MKKVNLFTAIMILLAGYLSVTGQEIDPPKMPKKIRKFLDAAVGTWNISGTFEGTGTYRWDEGKGALVGTGQWSNGEVSPSWTVMWYWDGSSADGLLGAWTATNEGNVSQGRMHGKAVSASVFEGKEMAVVLGKEFRDTLRIKHESPTRRTMTVTKIVHGGEPQPDMEMVFEKAGAAAPKPGSEHKKMGIFVGDWSYVGKVAKEWEGTDFGPAGKFEGKTSSRFSLNGFFVEEHWEETNESGSGLSGTVLFGYDPQLGKHFTHSFMSNGAMQEGIMSIGDRTVKENATITTPDGKTVLVKAVWHHAEDNNSFDANWKLSLDKGHTWKPWMKYKGKRISDRRR